MNGTIAAIEELLLAYYGFITPSPTPNPIFFSRESWRKYRTYSYDKTEYEVIRSEFLLCNKCDKTGKYIWSFKTYILSVKVLGTKEIADKDFQDVEYGRWTLGGRYIPDEILDSLPLPR